MSSYGPAPELGNLAWAPLPTVEAVEIIDRYNGVPTLGVARAQGETCLFWRILSDDEHVSVWLYVPLTNPDEEHLNADDDSDYLDTIVVKSSRPRYTTMGVAYDNRLVFEREWQLPADLSADDAALACLEFCAEAMRVALAQKPPLPATRRRIAQKASEAVKHLATC
ncbi:Hsp20/alpha crystallin family protein [Micromonospora sp. NPDC005174]|uniref:Hsp20/alpha crystallin family protein n=1 Tax=Micromonospora sp. NPDC005174 TaxID=3157018 RepID=UPI0033B0FCDB